MKHRLFPMKAQTTVLEQTLDACRWVYNKTLEMRKTTWEAEQRSVSYFEIKRMLPPWKAEYPLLEVAHSQVLQNVTERVDLAFKAFFRRVKAGEELGYLRFRGQHRYDNFTYPREVLCCSSLPDASDGFSPPRQNREPLSASLPRK